MPKFNTETGVETSTSISEKLAIGVMMLGALSVAMGIFLALPVFKEKTITGPFPFKPLQLTDGAPSTTSLKDAGTAEYEFLRDGLVLATYNKSGDSAFKENKDLNIKTSSSFFLPFFGKASAATMYSIEDPGSATMYSIEDPGGATMYSIEDSSFQPQDPALDPASKSPLQVKISQSVKELADIPALTFSLVTDIGNKTLCLPANILSQNEAVSYYYDVDGTPYFDSKLKNKAMNGTCQVNTIAYVPTTISEINFNEPYPESVPDGFAIYFSRYDQSLFVMTNNIFQKMTPDEELDFVEGGKASLVMSPGYVDSEQSEFTVPARLYTVNSNLGTHTLCFPEQTITGEWDESNQRYLGSGIPYYYDTNGTPYTDALLENSLACGFCSDGTYMDECNLSKQYCDPDTLELKYVCDKCGYECESGTGDKKVPVIEE